jgi:gamma-tubulin complex component 2
MSILEHTTMTVGDKKGGAMINSLWSLEKRVYMGDTVAKDLIGSLLNKCTSPYVEMLTSWLQFGNLRDPHGEFMIQQPIDRRVRAQFDGDAWMALFQIKEEHVIKDIIPNDKIKKKILITGKYWNAVQACHADVKALHGTSLPKMTKLQFQADSSALATYIENAYRSASTNLMHLMKDKFRMRDSLQIMKRYFLLDQGDFVTNFLDAAEEELMKPMEDISAGRVQHFLSMSIQITEAQRDGDVEPAISFGCEYDHQLYPNMLKSRFSSESLVAYLDKLHGDIAGDDPRTPSRRPYGSSSSGDNGFDLFTIDFVRVPFPTSLILSQHALQSYKLLFRHLFFSKHVERRLVDVWSDHQVLKKLDSLRGLLGPSFLLRQRMLHFVQNLNNYMTFEVVENYWLEMMASIDAPQNTASNEREQTVDDILNIHDAFLEKTIDACLLTTTDLIRSLTKLLNTCLLFTDQMRRFMATTRIVSFASGIIWTICYFEQFSNLLGALLSVVHAV